MLPHNVPLFRTGCAVFVKLWGLTVNSKIAEASRITAVLDAALLQLSGGVQNYFPSPYGGGVLIESAVVACEAALSLKRYLILEDIVVSIGIAKGEFERIDTGVNWNAVAPALNLAARIASWREAANQINVTPEVRNNAIIEGMSSDAFRDERTAKVKNTEFICVECRQDAKPLKVPVDDLNGAANFQANILVVDIEGYSVKTPNDQQQVVTDLSRLLQLAADSMNVNLSAQFEPAGDGGYFVFPADGASGTPHTFSFVHEVITAAYKKRIRIRTGLASGPVAKTSYRKAVSGTVIQADARSADAPVFGLAVNQSLWDTLGDPSFRGKWVELPIPSGSDVRRLFPKSVVGAAAPNWASRIKKLVAHRATIVLFSLLLASGLLWLVLNLGGSTESLDIEGSGFVSSGYMGDISALTVDPASAENPHSGPTCEKWTYRPTGLWPWVAVAWQHPDGNWGDVPGLDWGKRRFTQVSVWARGLRDSTGNLPRVQFKAGDSTTAGKPYQASFALAPLTVTLTEEWKQYTLDLKGQNLSQVIAAFVVVVRAQDVGPRGATFYLDDIQYR